MNSDNSVKVVLAISDLTDEKKKELAKKWDNEFEKYKTEIITLIKETYLAYKNNYHYEWYQDDCPYDDSGDIENKHILIKDLKDLTVLDFLNELSGNWTPTFESGRGRYFNTIGSELQSDLLNIGGNISEKIYKEYLAENNVELVEDEYYEFMEELDNEIENETEHYYKLWNYEELIGYLGISDKLIKEL